MSEATDTPQPPLNNTPEPAPISPEKEIAINEIGHKIIVFFQGASKQAILAKADIDSINSMGRLREAEEAGQFAQSRLRQEGNSAVAETVGNVKKGIKDSTEKVSNQIRLVRDTFREGEGSFAELSDFIRVKNGQWQETETPQFLAEIRKIIIDPVDQAQRLDRLYQEFRVGVTDRIKRPAEYLKQRSNEFERVSRELGGQTIKGLIGASTDIELLYGKIDSSSFSTVAERTTRMKELVQDYHKTSGKAMKELPNRFRDIEDMTLALESDLRNMFDQLTS